ncbi:alpha/beta hydrolase [Pseudomonas sp. JS3066]|jgi:pimeloyl-ACP methyl ester carboxylesterase|uniref:alpha/beta hydrolase n=1 Tax=unclassified Pseudomonas TaxID=196821 RepID=UPI000EA9FD66|nr:MULTISPECIES: alpha/beta hydrolase [unclassified Pseudomonas]AYF87663.1 alpha/beta hydrolase [Pseudomonas sp. DY-1]MDH4656393.1 alpha/beta hydrolase [Pseudomonas sp. BN606]MRK20064.1 alpha/beta hydrolase [Pseudomonas sp. JG-B]WVK94779.1 alpha/beta hydrolase [Pseudomonas sp. JS3066]
MKTINAQLATVALALATTFSAGVSHAESTLPSVVIVHGAFADGSDWAKVVPLLQAKGVAVTVVQNPLTSLADDVAATQRALRNQPGKVVLVGHSWGGTVISEAGNQQNVSALVYVAAFAPDAGQISGEQGKGAPTPPGISQIKPDANGFLYLTPEGMAKDFAQDLPAEQTAVMTATQGPIRASAFEDKTTVAAWRTKPSWYVLASEDRMIHPDVQRSSAKRIGAQLTELHSSHVPQQSQPADVAAVILKAVESVGHQ